MGTKRIEKILAVLVVLSFVSCMVYTDIYARSNHARSNQCGNGGIWYPGKRIVEGMRARHSGGVGDSGDAGGCYNPCAGGRRQSGGGSEGSVQSISGGEQASSGSSGSGKTSTKAKEFSTPCTSYTTKIEAGGESMTFEKVPGKQNKFQAGDTDKSPQEIIAKAKSMLTDPGVRVTTDSRYPSTISPEIARADAWKTASGERAGTIPVTSGGGIADLTVQQTLLSSDLQALKFDTIIETMGVATNPGAENQAKIAYKQAYETLDALPDDRLETIKFNQENAPTGLETVGPKIAEEILTKRKTVRAAEQKALTEQRAAFMNQGSQRADLRNPEMGNARELKAIELGFKKADGQADVEAFSQAIKAHEDTIIQTGVETKATRDLMMTNARQFAIDNSLDIARTEVLKELAEKYQAKITALKGQSYTDEVFVGGKKIATFTRLEAQGNGGWYKADDGVEQSWKLEIHDPSIFKDGKVTFPKDATVTRYFGTHEQFTKSTPEAVNRSISVGALYSASDMKKYIYAPAAEGVTGQIAPWIKINGTRIGNVATFDFAIE